MRRSQLVNQEIGCPLFRSKCHYQCLSESVTFDRTFRVCFLDPFTAQANFLDAMSLILNLLHPSRVQIVSFSCMCRKELQSKGQCWMNRENRALILGRNINQNLMNILQIFYNMTFFHKLQNRKTLTKLAHKLQQSKQDIRYLLTAMLPFVFLARPSFVN